MRAAEPLAAHVRAGAAALCFLTRLPLGRRLALDGEDVARGAVVFPLIGAGIGAIVGATAAVLADVLPALAAAGLALTLGAALTGAMHLDALADTADALTAGSRDRALEIMRDHAIGTYGATALVLDLVVKAAALAALTAAGPVVGVAAAAGALARAAPGALAAALPSVRADGAGAAFTTGASRGRAAVTCVLAGGLAVAAAGLDGALLAGVAAAAAIVLGLCFARWLGGVTGDMLGAAAEVTETLALLTAAALI